MKPAVPTKAGKPALRVVPAGARVRSAGSVALQALTVTQEEVADRLAVQQPLVARWGLGERQPSKAQKRVLHSEYSIPIDAWDRPPGNPPTPDRSKMQRVTARTFEEQTQALYEEVEIMRARAGFYRDNNDPKMYVRHMSEAGSLHALLAKLLGLTVEMTEERAARLPAVRRLAQLVVTALVPYPDACAAVAAIFGSFGR